MQNHQYLCYHAHTMGWMTKDSGRVPRNLSRLRCNKQATDTTVEQRPRAHEEFELTAKLHSSAEGWGRARDSRAPDPVVVVQLQRRLRADGVGLLEPPCCGTGAHNR